MQMTFCNRWAALLSLALCSTSITISGANAGESAYVYEGVESATTLIRDAERSNDPSVTVALDRGHDDSDRHARNGKLNLIRVNEIPALVYSLKYYGGLGYIPALVITCREKGLLEFSQVLWTSGKIDHKRYEPYILEYQGFGLGDLFMFPAELESVVDDIKGTAIRFRGTIKADHPGISRLGPTTNLQAYVRFGDMRFGADNSHHASTLGPLIDHCGSAAVDSPQRAIRANQSPTIPDREVQIKRGHLLDNSAISSESVGMESKKQSNARINAAIEYYGNAMDDVTKKFSSGRINYEQFRKLSKEISEASFAITETIEEAYKVYDFQIKYTDKIPVKE